MHPPRTLRSLESLSWPSAWLNVSTLPFRLGYISEHSTCTLTSSASLGYVPLSSLLDTAHFGQTEGLKRDLLIWSSGLFPFFQFAATSVRPLLINIYETYYLPLGADLRPAAKALILALLPGLEEETGDFFDKVNPFKVARWPLG